MTASGSGLSNPRDPPCHSRQVSAGKDGGANRAGYARAAALIASKPRDAIRRGPLSRGRGCGGSCKCRTAAMSGQRFHLSNSTTRLDKIRNFGH